MSVVTRRERRVVALGAALLLTAQGARPAPAAAPAAAEGRRARLCFHAFADAGAGAAALVVRTTFAASLAREPRLMSVALDDALRNIEQEDGALAAADAAVAAARKKIEELDLGEATKLLRSALAAYEANLHRMVARARPVADLVDAHKLLAAARFIDGDQAGARDALRRARVLQPDLAYDASLFPPQMRRVFTEAKLLFDELGLGSLAVSSEPPGAAVLVNGVHAGFTPLRVEGLGSGPNYVTVLATGHPPRTTTAEVAGGEENRVEVQLPRADDDPVPTLSRAGAAMGEPLASDAVREIARRAHAELFLAAVVSGTAAEARVSVYLYDLRSGKLARQVKRAAAPQEPEKVAAELVAVIDPGALAAGPEEPPEESRPRPPSAIVRYASRVRHWRYFWHAAAVLGAVAVTSVVVGVAVSSSRDHGIDPRWPLILSGREAGFSF
jgi:hypothetical protein